MTKHDATRKQRIIDYIAATLRARGYPPTVREIGVAVNLSSSSTVHAHLRALEDAGVIKRDAVLTRAIKLLPGTISRTKMPRIVSIPIVGQVAAGKPTLAAEDLEEMFPLPHDFLGGAEGFMLRVRGDSMIEDGICDGDLVIVRRQDVAENGDRVVALLENEATVKRFYRENGGIRLQPANSTMSPILVDDAKILGKVVGLVRKM